MTTQVTVALPDAVYQRVRRLANVAGRTTSDVLADMITIVIQPAGAASALPLSYAEMSDNDLLSLADLQLDPAKDRRLSQLLNAQQAGTISNSERAELALLMQLYEESLLRKAQSYREAVQRGLRPPIGL